MVEFVVQNSVKSCGAVDLAGTDGILAGTDGTVDVLDGILEVDVLDGILEVDILAGILGVLFFENGSSSESAIADH